MNLQHLRYFHVVAKERSFSRAAAALRIAQPSISKTIKLLEEDLGLQLLRRTTREVQLTSDGQIVFEHAERVFEELGALDRRLKRTVISREVPLVLGTTDAIAVGLLPEILRPMMHATTPLGSEPRLQLGDESRLPARMEMDGKREDTAANLYPVVQTGAAADLCDLLERRKLEFALLFHLPEVPAQLMVRRLARVRFHLVCAKRFVDRGEVLDSFIGSREVDEEGAKRFPTLEKWRRHRPEARIRLSSNSLTAHLEMVRQGLGVSVLPCWMVHVDLRRGRLVDLLPHENLQFDLKLVTRQAHRLSPGATILIRTLEKNLEAGV